MYVRPTTRASRTSPSLAYPSRFAIGSLEQGLGEDFDLPGGEEMELRTESELLPDPQQNTRRIRRSPGLRDRPQGTHSVEGLFTDRRWDEALTTVAPTENGYSYRW